jgi:hypothetical protein
MAAKSSNNVSTKRGESTPEDVERYLAALDHPRKPEILAIRQLILAADQRITEGIKWNVPSFRTSEYFATMHLRAPDGIQVILHLGAKPRDGTSVGLGIADPEALLAWLAPDRAAAKFRDLADIDARRSAFTEIIRQWITHV